jgi:hypothetical protein
MAFYAGRLILLPGMENPTILSERNQLFNDLRGFDRTVLVLRIV